MNICFSLSLQFYSATFSAKITASCSCQRKKCKLFYIVKELSNLSGVRKKEDFLDYVKDYNKQPDADNVWDALTESQQADWIDAYIRDGAIKGVEKPNIRHKIYKRAGFGDEVYTTQYAIVRSSPDGKGRWLTPVNAPRLENGQVDDEGFAALINKLS